MPVETADTFSLSKKEKIFNTRAMVTCKDLLQLKKNDKLALSMTKNKPKLLQGFISPLDLVVAMENTSNPRCQLIHK